MKRLVGCLRINLHVSFVIVVVIVIVLFGERKRSHR